ncbi:MAG TPA: PQQ-binding-like beta-propeller repeat protein [Candidatus Dormibacteraeota bacterium]|nr:PQQ-binding-like beta-propeller repeat protein [Candidatus Dormibacteraeota bacterium]
MGTPTASVLRWTSALSLALCACSTHYASPAMGVAGTPDPRVTVFRADRERSWSSFRLGGGLNVVVASRGLPREFAWRFPTGGISSSPTVIRTTILVSANDDHLYAIDASTGALRWRYHAENEIMSQPAYAHGLVYVGIGNSENTAYDPPYFTVVGSGMNKLEAISANTGIEQWWSGLDGTGMPSPAVVGSNVIAVTGHGTVLAVDAKRGTFRWRRELETVFAMSSVVSDADGRLYLCGRFQNAVFALNANDGNILWTHTFDRLVGGVGDDPLASTPGAVIGDYLQPLRAGPFGMFVTYGSVAREHVYALDKRDGHLLWDRTLGAVQGVVPRYNESAIALVYGDRVYVGSTVAPIVTALDAHSGRVVWQLHVGGPVKGGIAARDGILYFGDLTGVLWAVDARSGRAVGRVATDMHFNVGSPIIVNDSLVDGGLEDVIALPLSNIRASQPMPGVTSLSLWQKIARGIASVVPHRDPHREAAYYR